VNHRISHFLNERIHSERGRRLLSNFVSLSVLQGANYVLPLLTLPYLIRVLGPEKFGLLAFATAITAYFSILTDYGFNLSATREISINRQSQSALTTIFSSVMIVKVALLLASFVLLVLIVFLVPKFSAHWPVYFLSFGAVLGQVLFPVWFFQGVEQMKYVTYLNIGAKAAFTVMVFMFVHTDADYYLVPTLTSAGAAVAGIWSLFIVRSRFGIRFEWQDWPTLSATIGKGWYVFIATSFGSLYRESNTVILGLLGSNAVVGYYAIAEKIVKAIQSLQTPVGQALFPFLSSKGNVLRDYVMKHWKSAAAIYASLWGVVFLCSSFIVHHLAGSVHPAILRDFRILSGIIFVGGLSFYFGVLGLLSDGRGKEFSGAVAVAGATNVVSCLLLAYLFQDAGASFSLLLSEIVLLVLISRKVASALKADANS
jgi:PST family polysaccharide transporter